MRALTARELGTALGSSARPIFTVFKNMEEVQLAVVVEAKNIYWKYIERLKDFQKIGLQYIHFAQEEPKLFQLIFMAEDVDSPLVLKEITNDISMYYNNINIMKEQFNFDNKESNEFLKYLWIFGHGIATLLVSNQAKFSDEEIEQMLYDVGAAMFVKITSHEE